MGTEVTAKDGRYIFKPQGPVDTKTSPELQKQMLEQLGTADIIELDLETTTYLSSAGLRVLLMLQKLSAAKGKSFVVSHVSPIIMEVLALTGTANLLTII